MARRTRASLRPVDASLASGMAPRDNGPPAGRRTRMTPPRKSSSKNKEPSFEDGLSRLEALVEDLEGGRLSLEEGVERYREGVLLLQTLQNSLGSAEQRVEELTEVLRRGLAELEEGAEAGEEEYAGDEQEGQGSREDDG